MLRTFILLCSVAVLTVSCQFTETMTLNEDGTGRMSIQMDLSEMMAFGGEMGQDSTVTKVDSIIAFKDILEEKKDSIAQLPKAEQDKLKSMENYMIHFVSDTEAKTMIMDVYVDFKSVAEANNLMQGLNQAEGAMPGMSSSSGGEEEGEDKPQTVGVKYSFEEGVFRRDAYIIDEKAHQQQLDSMKQAEAFMAETKYTLKYTFPRRIKQSSIEDAMFTMDGKTIEVERKFLEYLKNPDILDLEIELED